jgi:hypothetical protein
MALLFQVDEQVPAEQTPELILRCGGREVSSLGACPSALCTMALNAQVGQEGIGETHQMQVDHCSPIGAVLVLAEPQQRFGVFHERLDPPPRFVRLDQACCRALRGVCHSPKDLPGLSCPRADDVQQTQLAHVQPAGIKAAIARAPLGLHTHQGGGAVSPEQMLAIAAGCERLSGNSGRQFQRVCRNASVTEFRPAMESESAPHQMNVANVDHRSTRLGFPFIVFAVAPIATIPRIGMRHHPTFL